MPPQLEHENLKVIINGLYHHFLKLLLNKQALNGGHINQPNYKDVGGNYQRHVMTLIENHFRDSDRTIEINFDIVRFFGDGNNYNIPNMVSPRYGSESIGCVV